VGVALEREGKEFLVRADGGVVLACAGFEWNEEMKEKFLPGPLTHPQSPPFNEGDGLVMAMEVGADVGNMTEAWWIPSGVVVGEEYEGKGLSRFIVAERNLPHTIMVNRFGERFVNEGATYNEMGRVFHQFDPNVYGHHNLPCWLVFDRQYRERYPLMTVMPGDPDPEWLERDETLEGLGLKVGIDPQRLQATVNRWNGFVHQDRDLDFNRGQRAIERYYGDPGYREPNFGTIEKPPYYALPLYPGALGTKGGPRINVKGQVLNVRGEVIGGLYGAGNVVASPAGPAYWAGGGTIGPAMTWGYICGTNAAKEAKGA
jgi:succinate dehydrogenase/fumarate reductase flavoprotein subunit